MSRVSVRAAPPRDWYSMTRRSSLMCRVDSGQRRSVDQRAHMVLIIEARHRVVGLRRKARARDAPARERLEHRKAPAADQPVHQRGDEHGLAGARQAGDAEPHRRVDEMAAPVEQCASGEFGFLQEVGEERRHSLNI